MLQEVIAPLTEDITQEGTLGLKIIRDLERAMHATQDFNVAQGDEFLEGDWGRLTADGLSLEAIVGAVGADDMLFPVWCGNGDRYDAVATGHVTVITCGDWIYETSRFDQGGVYAVGTPLTVKNGKVPTPAGVSDPVIGKVVKPVVGGILTIQVVRK